MAHQEMDKIQIFNYGNNITCKLKALCMLGSAHTAFL